MPNNDRKAALNAASVLLKNYIFTPDGKYRKTSWHPDHDESGFPMEQILEEKLEEARKELDHYRESRAFWMALDSLLPGWFDIDVSDHVGSSERMFFVSNDPQEWFDWMIEQGIEEKEAKRFLVQAGHPLREGAS